MRVAVVGAGAAGLTAALRLQQAGHSVEVIEALDVVGGRTHTAHFGSGHLCDTGAGWLASFYPRTLALLDELGGREKWLKPREGHGADGLLVHGHVHRLPFSREAIAASALLSAEEKERVKVYLARLSTEQPGDLRADLRYDGHDAVSELAPLGAGILDYVMRPTFEGPFFTPLDTLSAAMVRAWLRALLDGAFYQVAGGMDAPWRELAEDLDVRLNEPAEAAWVQAGGVEVASRVGTRRYDGAILAVPAPVAAQLLASQPESAPAWLDEVRYVPAVRVYAARRSEHDANFGVHVAPPQAVVTVEFYAGRRGAWGACPADWQWGLVSAPGWESDALLDRPVEEVSRDLWAAGRAVVPELFRLEQAEVVQLTRWPRALPVMGPGHYTRLAAFTQRPPLVLAGDWTQEACVEGAVRSGEAAAAVFAK